MRYLSLCSGIEAASVAWHHLGWTPVAFSEIEPFPSAVLAHRFPNVPNLGDMTRHAEWPLGPGSIDLLVGGTPCQSFSVAGLRKGLSDPRGGLMLTYLEIAQRLRPRWIVWENVPGVLSSGSGRDLGAFLGALGELGYGWAYRVLDAQWVRTQRHPRAVPQRRRRIFVVGCLGDPTAAAQVLFERESVCRDSAPRRAQGEGVAGTLAARSGECRNNHEQLVTSHEVAPCSETTSNDYSRADGFTMVAGTLGNRGLRSHTEIDGHGAYVPVMSIQGAATRANPASGPDGSGVSCVTVKGDGGGSKPHVQYSMTVRRLTPREYERLQGFPDDWTLIPWRGKPADECPDGPRYKALGNSMACNCMAWIGERINTKENT